MDRLYDKLVADEEQQGGQVVNGAALSRPRRIRSIDTIRGLAMILVIYSHAKIVLDPGTVSNLTYTLLQYSSMIASVTFMVVSGTMISYFLYSGRSFDRVYYRYLKRAALLLIIVHPIIRFLAYPVFAGEVSFFNYLTRYVPITDTIGVSLLIAPFLIIRLNDRARALVIIACLTISPLIAEFVLLDNSYLTGLKELIFGAAHGQPTVMYVFFPIVPWLGIFLIGSYFGKVITGLQKGSISMPAISRLARRYAVELALFCLFTIGAYKILKMQFGTVWDMQIFHLLYPQRTTSFLPGFLAIIILAVSFLVTRIDYSGHYGFFSRAAAVFGRTSLFTFVTQFAVVWSLPTLIGIKNSWDIFGFAGYVIATLIICWLLSFGYEHLRTYWRQHHLIHKHA